jgi:hypothetical protein
MIRSSGDSQVWSGKRSQINGGITADGSGLARAVGRYLVVVIPPPGAAATCGDQAEPSPAARREGGLKRPVASDRYGIPPGIASAGANRHDSPLPATALQAAARQLDGRLPDDRTCHLDRGYDSTVTRELLTRLGFSGQIARKGVPAPVQAGTRWVVERTHTWMNGYGKLRRCTERDAADPDIAAGAQRDLLFAGVLYGIAGGVLATWLTTAAAVAVKRWSSPRATPAGTGTDAVGGGGADAAKLTHEQ